MKMPQDDNSIKRNALQRLRDSFANQMLDAESLQNTMERSNPMLAQIREGAVSGGVMPVGGLGSAVEGATKGLADKVGGAVVRENMGFGGIVNAPAKSASMAESMAANAKPRLSKEAQLAILKKLGM